MTPLPLQRAPILQRRLPDSVVASLARRLPGTGPVAGDWIVTDEAYAAQMALRDRLIAGQRDRVHAMTDGARDAAAELFDVVLGKLAATRGFAVGADAATRPDGVAVALDADRPLLTLGRLVQEDLCLMEEAGGIHRLTGAILCFPASWRLDEKIGRPLIGIHDPVRVYDDDLARRVQRLFHGLREGHPLERANFLRYDLPDLFQPRSEAGRRDRPNAAAPYLRAERQCLVRLPRTRAVVFSIHTFVLEAGRLDPDQVAALADRLAESD